MIRRLIILLLIVGCAHKPPQATFYIGMSEQNFIRQNNIKFDNSSNFLRHDSGIYNG